MNSYAVPSIPHHYNPFSPLQHNALPTQMNTSYPQHNGQHALHMSNGSNELLPENYLLERVDRNNGQSGGGLAIVYTVIL